MKELLRKRTEGLFKISDEVVRIFKPHGNADHSFKGHRSFCSGAVALDQQTFVTAPRITSPENLKRINHRCELIGIRRKAKSRL